MPNTRSSQKKALGCYLPVWKLERIKDIATGHDLTTTDLVSYLVDECIAKDEAGLEVLPPPKKERPTQCPKKPQGIKHQNGRETVPRTQNPLLHRVQVRSLSPVVFG